MISPSALATFEKDRDEYYLKYLSEPKPERSPQSEPASVGSAFDARVKANLMADLLGVHCGETHDALFESQVEPHNRDFALNAGLHCFNSYLHCGAYRDLATMMEDAQEEPQFEFNADVTIDGIPLFGKPDARFVDANGNHIVLDWKVNGYCGKANTSPAKGYALCRDGLGYPKPSRSHGKSHKLYKPRDHNGVEINDFNLEHISIDWADQLTMYGWMMGETPGDEIIVCIDQITGKGIEGSNPALRIANHRATVSKDYQLNLVKRLKDMWGRVQSGQIFEGSAEKCAEICRRLDNVAVAVQSDGTAQGDFLAQCFRGSSIYRAR